MRERFYRLVAVVGFVNLDLCNGPPCPDCECRDTKRVRFLEEGGTRRLGGGGTEKMVRRTSYWVCNYCGFRWVVSTNWQPAEDGDGARYVEPEAPAEVDQESGAVVYHLVRCPECKSDRTQVKSTKRPVRYHKCLDCGHSFKSVER